MCNNPNLRIHTNRLSINYQRYGWNNLKLEEITWKEDSLWYLTKPMTDEDIIETHTFQQQSNFGVFEGTVIIIESRANEQDLTEYKKWNEEYDMSWNDYRWYKSKGYSLNDILDGSIDYSDYQE